MHGVPVLYSKSWLFQVTLGRLGTRQSTATVAGYLDQSTSTPGYKLYYSMGIHVHSKVLEYSSMPMHGIHSNNQHSALHLQCMVYSTCMYMYVYVHKESGWCSGVFFNFHTHAHTNLWPGFESYQGLPYRDWVQIKNTTRTCTTCMHCWDVSEHVCRYVCTSLCTAVWK